MAVQNISIYCDATSNINTPFATNGNQVFINEANGFLSVKKPDGTVALFTVSGANITLGPSA